MRPLEDEKLAHDLEPWFCEGLFIHESAIHGIGLFTSAGALAGALIIRFGGRLLHLTQRRSIDVIPSTAIPLAEEIILVEPDEGEKDFSDFLNHSCDPNLGFRDAVSLVAIRDIAQGEELVIDYAFWECDPAWRLRQTCNCGSVLCRKAVSGKDWQAVARNDRRLQFFSPFLRRRILTYPLSSERGG